MELINHLVLLQNLLHNKLWPYDVDNNKLVPVLCKEPRTSAWMRILRIPLNHDSSFVRYVWQPYNGKPERDAMFIEHESEQTWAEEQKETLHTQKHMNTFIMEASRSQAVWTVRPWFRVTLGEQMYFCVVMRTEGHCNSLIPYQNIKCVLGCSTTLYQLHIVYSVEWYFSLFYDACSIL